MSNHNLGIKKWSIILVIFILLLVGMTVSIHSIFQNNHISIDFMFYWHAGRTLFFNNGDPYGPELAYQNQLWVYGAPARPGQDHLNFAYPLFILIPLLPFIILPYEWAFAAWMSTNLSVLLSLGIFIFPKAPKWIPFALLCIYEVYFTIIIGNTALMICVILLVVLEWLIFSETKAPVAYWVAGIALSFTIGKPQLVWLFLVLIAAICIQKKNWTLLVGFITSSLIMAIGLLILYPKWPINWVLNASNYSNEGGLDPTIIWFLSKVVATPYRWPLYFILLIAGLIVLGFLYKNWSRGLFPSIVLIAWCAWITTLFDPSSFSPDRNILWIPVVLWAVRQTSLKKVILTFGLGVLLSNAAFFLSLINLFPSAVEIWTFSGYSLWLFILTYGYLRSNRR